MPVVLLAANAAKINGTTFVIIKPTANIENTEENINVNADTYINIVTIINPEIPQPHSPKFFTKSIILPIGPAALPANADHRALISERSVLIKPSNVDK
jgi:hypothetical protein